MLLFLIGGFGVVKRDFIVIVFNLVVIGPLSYSCCCWLCRVKEFILEVGVAFALQLALVYLY